MGVVFPSQFSPSLASIYKPHSGMFVCAWCSWHSSASKSTQGCLSMPGKVSSHVSIIVINSWLPVCQCVFVHHILSACTLWSIFIVGGGIVIVSPSQSGSVTITPGDFSVCRMHQAWGCHIQWFGIAEMAARCPSWIQMSLFLVENAWIYACLTHAFPWDIPNSHNQMGMSANFRACGPSLSSDQNS